MDAKGRTNVIESEAGATAKLDEAKLECLWAWDGVGYKKLVTEIYSCGTHIGSALVPSPLYFFRGFCYFLRVHRLKKRAALCTTHSNPLTSSWTVESPCPIHEKHRRRILYWGLRTTSLLQGGQMHIVDFRTALYTLSFEVNTLPDCLVQTGNYKLV